MAELIVGKEPLLVSEGNKKGEEHSSEKIRSLRAAIDAKLHEQGIYEQIRDLVHLKSKTATSFNGTGDKDHQTNGDENSGDTDNAAQVTEDILIRDVLESEVVQQLLSAFRTMKLTTIASNDDTSTKLEDADDVDLAAEAKTERDVVLYLRLSGGKAFVDQLVELEQNGDNREDEVDVGLVEANCPVGSVLTFFRVNVTFQQQRYTSRDVRCCVDPPFDEHFRFHVEKIRTRTTRTRGGTAFAVDVALPWEALCLVEEPVQLDLVKVTKKILSRDERGRAHWRELSRELLAVHRVDWRRILCSTLQLVHFPLQLAGRMKEPVGSLDIRADLLNFKRSSSIAGEARSFLSKEALQRNASNHSFYKYAKQWWDEYRSESREIQRQSPRGSAGMKTPGSEDDEYSQLLAQIGYRQRLVKMFAEDEEGRYRMVCKFVTPLRVPTAVRGPSEAARFVGLLPYESNALVGGASDETWRSLATVLSLCKGDAQDHAVLLASLLLGCGLDAYVCIGTISASKSTSQFARGSQRSYDEREITRSRSTSAEVGHIWVLTRGSSPTDVLLWEAITGEKFALNDHRAPRRRGYCAIDCVFNHRQFFANLQPRSWKLAESSFDFDDESTWKRMDESLIADLPFAQPSVAMIPPALASVPAQELEWSSALKHVISSHRRAEGLVTRWSDDLCFYLLPALNSYELERLYGVTQVENNFFQQSVTGFVQEGHTFQGVPSMFTVESPAEAFASMQSNPLVADILALHARSAHFALAVRCFPYTQHTCATWVMLAVSYQSTS